MTGLKPKDVAGRLHCSEDTIEREIQRGQLPAVRIGRKVIRILEEDLRQYLAERRTPPAAP